MGASKADAVEPANASHAQASDRPARAPTSVSQQLGNDHMRQALVARAQAASVDADPWSRLSPGARRRAQSLNDEVMALVGQLLAAQKANVSPQRTEWLDYLTQFVLARIGSATEADIGDIEADFKNYAAGISEVVAEARADWAAVQHRAVDERDWLARQQFSDATLAAKRIEDLYRETGRRLDLGAIAFITTDDYGLLKLTLEKGTHLSLGMLQASRDRAQLLNEMLDVVIELRVSGDDAEKYVPGWRARVATEADNLARLSARTHVTPGTDYPAEFARLRAELLHKLDTTLATHKREKPALEKGIDLVTGAADAIVGPLVEAGKQAVDLVQINLHFATLGHYMPRFISNLSKAAEQGATTTDLLKGMVTGLLGAPGRFVQAVEDGDWEGIGREAVNIYMLAKAIKQAPEYFSRLPELVAMTQRGLRILRARTIGGILNEPRLAPTERTMTGIGGPPKRPPGKPPKPPPQALAVRPPVTSREWLMERLRRGVDQGAPRASLKGEVRNPPPAGEFRAGITRADVAYTAYNEGLAQSAGREVGLFHNQATGEYRVMIGDGQSVNGPYGDWDAIVHYHPNPTNTLTFRLPAQADFNTLFIRAFRENRLVAEFVEYDIPGVGRGRTEYGIDPSYPDRSLFVRIHHADGTVDPPMRFASSNEYWDYWRSRSVYVEHGSEDHAAMIKAARDYLRSVRKSP